MKKHTSKSDKVAKSNPAAYDTKLTPEQQTEFTRLEKQIAENYEGAFTLAAALAQIRDQKLYRAEHQTFDEYCQKRWEYSRSYCYRLLDTNSVMTDLKGFENTDVYPRNEAQARVFGDLDKNDRIKLAQTVLEKSTENTLTASVFNKFKKQLFPSKTAIHTKKKPKAIDVETKIIPMPSPPSILKLLAAAEKMLQGLEDDGLDEGNIADGLRAFIKEAKSWVVWEKKGK